jgi:glycosyltransferase involved in cell wall biosynthesis
MQTNKIISNITNDTVSGLCSDGKSNNISLPRQPLVSIITVVKNGERFLEETIRSVLDQTYDNIEHIIIDGGSTDGTLEIIKKYGDRIAFWLSEQDQGIADAFNKGMLLSSGDIIGLVNCDDWLSPDQIAEGVKGLRNSSADFVFGDLLHHDSEGSIFYKIYGDPDYGRRIRSRMPELCHPTVLTWKKTYDRVGLFDVKFRYAMDYEWLLRLHNAGGTGLYVKSMVGHMRVGGVSDYSYRKALREVREISVRYGKPPLLANCLYVARIMKGFLRRVFERHAPRYIYDRVRGIINKRYSPE